MVKVKRVF